MTISLTTALVFKGQLQRIPEQYVGLTGNPRHLPPMLQGRFTFQDLPPTFEVNLDLNVSPLDATVW